MEPKNQGDGPESSSNILFKKKRGRPRKDQSQNLSRFAHLLTMGDQIQGHGGIAQFPPGFAMADGNHSHQGNAAQHNDDAMVGQAVNGVIEATFDAGYFLSVRIGNSDTTLRGVVFKPGHYLTPQIEMVSTNAVPFSAGHHTPVHSSYRRGRDRGMPRKESRRTYSANGSSSGNELVTLLGDRGSLVPVVLEPANLSSGVAPDIGTPPAVSQPAHLAAFKASVVNQTRLKQMEKHLETDNGPPSTEETRNIQGSASNLPVAVVEELAKTRNIQGSASNLPVAVVEELASDVVKTNKGLSRSKEIQSENRQPSGAFANEKMRDLNEPFLVKPLQAMLYHPFNGFPSVPLKFGDARPRPGKMTELLMAMQENVIGKQAYDVQHHGFSRY